MRRCVARDSLSPREPLEILFVRHAQPAWVADERPNLDPELTDLGREQARRVAERLAERGAGELLSSPAVRALRTAEPIAERVGQPVEVVEGLLEIGLPDWSHLSLEEVAKQFRKAREREPQAWWEGLPGGERFHDFSARVTRTVDELLEARGVRRLPDEGARLFTMERDLGRLVVVGHGGTNTVAMSHLLGIPSVPWEWERFTLSRAGLLRLKTVPLGRGVIFSVRAFNDVEHLPKAMRTV